MALDNLDLRERYRQALAAYVDCGEGEAELATALELGRLALAKGCGIVNLLAIHHSAVQGLLAGLPGEAALARMTRAYEFLAQSAAPFEMAERGWREMINRL